MSQEQPGLNIDEIAARIGLSRGATRYHLRMLLRGGHITTQRQGHHVLHFGSGTPPLRRKAVALLRVRSARLLVEALVRKPDIHVSTLARESGLSARSVRRSIAQLVGAGLAQRNRTDRLNGQHEISLHPEARVAWVLWCKGANTGAETPTPKASPAWLVSVEGLVLLLISSLM